MVPPFDTQVGANKSYFTIVIGVPSSRDCLCARVLICIHPNTPPWPRPSARIAHGAAGSQAWFWVAAFAPGNLMGNKNKYMIIYIIINNCLHIIYNYI